MSSSPGHVIVVGAGVFGAVGALELRRRGWRVTLVDRGPPPHPEASSTDVSKVVRMDYGSDVFYHELGERALEGWDRWNRDWPEPPYHEDGFLILSGEPMRAGSFEHESWRVLRDRGHAPRRLEGSDLGTRHPRWAPGVFADGYFNPRAGWAASGAVVARLVRLCIESGVELSTGVVSRPTSHGSRVSGVELDGGNRLSGDRVVLAAGAWTPRLLPALGGVLWPTAQPVLHFGVEDAERYRPPDFPPWAADISRSGWYGFPALPDGRLKIAHHGPGRRVEPADRGGVGPEHEAACRAFLARALPDLAARPVVGSRVCMYCDSVDGDFLIARDPDRHGLVVASGGSGHGFKFAPVLGRIVADALEGLEHPAAARFGWRSGGVHRTEEARFDG